MKALRIILVTMAVSAAVPCLVRAQQPPQKLALAQALDMAARQNLDLIAARAQRAVAAAGVRIAGQRPNPAANFTALRDDPHEGLFLDLPLEIGPKRGRRIDLARQQSALTDDDIAALERLTRQSARDAFFALALARSTTQQKSGVLKLAQQLQSIAESRFEAGDVPQLEVEQANLGVAQAQADFQMAQQEEKVALSALDALLNEPPGTDWELVTPLETMPAEGQLSDLLTRAGNANYELQKIAQQERVEQSQRALLRAQRIPNLNLQFGVDLNSPRNFRYGPRGQINMEMPIFSRNQGEIAESSATLIALEDQAAATRRAVDGRVEQAFYELDAREAQAKLYKETLVPSATRLEGMAEESYKAGKANILYVLDAQKNVQQVQQAYLQSLFTLQQAFAQLEETVGAPLD
ncbi:MAG TPA: TolC family protein [Candidatus Acidoferrales bacterium]|nr:TolC family protein [Candidatus Acidoferrales bacterium]